MIEIRIHGRGGQGSVTMAELLAEAAFYGGKEAQAFPNFGVERRGAPVTAYIRIDNKPIRLRSQIYHPDYLIIQDASLISDLTMFKNLKSETLIIINTEKNVKELKLPQNLQVKTINASALALEIIGKPIINTILLGAFVGVTGLIKLTAAEKVVKERFSEKFSQEIVNKNIRALRRGAKEIIK